MSLNSNKFPEPFYTIIQNYEFLEELGQGSYGTVYKAFNNNEFYAIKVISKEYVQEQKLQSYVEEEIFIMKKFDDKNIVKIIDHFQDSHFWYIVMEFCNQGTLNQYIKKNQITYQQNIEIFIQILRGFRAIHGLGIIHRDLKPDNIFIKDDVFKIGDFGFAKMAGEGQTQCGCKLYMAPELFLTCDHDYKADIWSLGVIFFYMIFQTYPFENKSAFLDEIIDKTTPTFQPEKILNQTIINEKMTSELKEFFQMVFQLEPDMRINFEDLYELSIIRKNLNESEQEEAKSFYYNLSLENSSRFQFSQFSQFSKLQSNLTVQNQVQQKVQSPFRKQFSGFKSQTRSKTLLKNSSIMNRNSTFVNQSIRNSQNINKPKINLNIINELIELENETNTFKSMNFEGTVFTKSEINKTQLRNQNLNSPFSATQMSISNQQKQKSKKNTTKTTISKRNSSTNAAHEITAIEESLLKRNYNSIFSKGSSHQNKISDKIKKNNNNNNIQSEYSDFTDFYQETFKIESINSHHVNSNTPKENPKNQMNKSKNKMSQISSHQMNLSKNRINQINQIKNQMNQSKNQMNQSSKLLTNFNQIPMISSEDSEEEGQVQTINSNSTLYNKSRCTYKNESFLNIQNENNENIKENSPVQKSNSPKSSTYLVSPYSLRNIVGKKTVLQLTEKREKQILQEKEENKITDMSQSKKKKDEPKNKNNPNDDILLNSKKKLQQNNKKEHIPIFSYSSKTIDDEENSSNILEILEKQESNDIFLKQNSRKNKSTSHSNLSGQQKKYLQQNQTNKQSQTNNQINNKNQNNNNNDKNINQIYDKNNNNIKNKNKYNNKNKISTSQTSIENLQNNSNKPNDYEIDEEIPQENKIGQAEALVLSQMITLKKQKNNQQQQYEQINLKWQNSRIPPSKNGSEKSPKNSSYICSLNRGQNTSQSIIQLASQNASFLNSKQMSQNYIRNVNSNTVLNLDGTIFQSDAIYGPTYRNNTSAYFSIGSGIDQELEPIVYTFSQQIMIYKIYIKCALAASQFQFENNTLLIFQYSQSKIIHQKTKQLMQIIENKNNYFEFENYKEYYNFCTSQKGLQILEILKRDNKIWKKKKKLLKQDIQKLKLKQNSYIYDFVYYEDEDDSDEEEQENQNLNKLCEDYIENVFQLNKQQQFIYLMIFKAIMISSQSQQKEINSLTNEIEKEFSYKKYHELLKMALLLLITIYSLDINFDEIQFIDDDLQEYSFFEFQIWFQKASPEAFNAQIKFIVDSYMSLYQQILYYPESQDLNRSKTVQQLKLAERLQQQHLDENFLSSLDILSQDSVSEIKEQKECQENQENQEIQEKA